MSTARDLMQRARDLHPAFTLPQTPDAVLLRYLDRARDRLYQDAATVNRAHFMRLLETPYTIALLTDGVTLPSHQWLGNVRVRTSIIGSTENETVPLPLRERPMLTTSGLTMPYAVVEQRVITATPQNQLRDVLALYPTNPGSWESVTAILVDYLPRLTKVTTLETDIDMAVDADDPLVDDLALFMARRGASTEGTPIKMTDFKDAAAGSRTTYFNSLAERRKPKVMQIREGMP